MVVSLLHSPVDLTLGVTLSRGLSFVVKLFALAQAHLDLHPAALEVDAQGDQGIAVLLDLAEQAHDLALVHQQTAGAAGIHIEAVAVVVRGDVHLIEDELAVLDAAPGILQIQGTLTNGFDLRAHQFDAGLIFLFDEVFVPGLPVGGHDLDAVLFQFAHLLKYSHYIITHLSRGGYL